MAKTQELGQLGMARFDFRKIELIHVHFQIKYKLGEQSSEKQTTFSIFGHAHLAYVFLDISLKITWSGATTIILNLTVYVIFRGCLLLTRILRSVSI